MVQVKSRYDEIQVKDVSPVGSILYGDDINPDDLHIYIVGIIDELPDEWKPEYDDEEYIPSATNGDYSPSNPWDAPGCSIKDFI